MKPNLLVHLVGIICGLAVCAVVAQTPPTPPAALPTGMVSGPAIGITPGKDITAPLQAWINATAAADAGPSFGHPGASWLYLPRGMYTVSKTIDWSPLTHWGLLGDPDLDGSNFGTCFQGNVDGPIMSAGKGKCCLRSVNIRNTNLGTPVIQPANATAPNVPYAISGTGIGLACNSTRLTAELCQFTAVVGCQGYSLWESTFNSCKFNGPSGTVAPYVGKVLPYSIGLLIWGPTGCGGDNCDFTGWGEGLRTAGAGFSLTKSRFEVNWLGMRLGADPCGTNYGFSRGFFAALSMEANDRHIVAQDIGYCAFSGIGTQGSTNAPSGLSTTGLQIVYAHHCTFGAIGMGGTYSGNAIQVDDHASNDLVFQGVQAWSGNVPSSWSIGKTNTNVVLQACNN
jgi:hypothetical protein